MQDRTQSIPKILLLEDDPHLLRCYFSFMRVRNLCDFPAQNTEPNITQAATGVADLRLQGATLHLTRNADVGKSLAINGTYDMAICDHALINGTSVPAIAQLLLQEKPPLLLLAGTEPNAQNEVLSTNPQTKDRYLSLNVDDVVLIGKSGVANLINAMQDFLGAPYRSVRTKPLPLNNLNRE